MMAKKYTKGQQALLDAAKVLLAENPGASFIEVAKSAGVGRATLYRHFPNREALLKALTLEAIQAMDQVSNKVMSKATSSTDALRLMIDALVPLGDHYYFLNRLPELDDEEINDNLRRQNNEMKTLILAIKQENKIADQCSTEWASSVFNSLMYSAWEELNRGELSAQEVSHLLFRTLMHGLSPLDDQ